MSPPATVARAQWRFLLFIVFVSLTIGAAMLRTRAGLSLTPTALRETIRSWGALGPLVFTGAFILRPFLFFPSTLLFLAGGLAFGVGWGTVYAAVGGTLGAVVGFGIARFMGHDFVYALLGERLSRVEKGSSGPGLVFFLNLLPIVPITWINYGAGLSGMELFPFTLAVVAGLTPRAFAYSFFGHSLLDIHSRGFLAGLGMLAALVVLPLCARRYLHRRAAAPIATRQLT